MENPQYLVQEGNIVAVKQCCGWVPLHPKTGFPMYIVDEHGKKVAKLGIDGWTYLYCGL